MAKQMPDDMGRSGAERLPTRAGPQEPPSEVESAARKEARLRKLSVFNLRPHPLQPAERHSAENVRDLMESIRSMGLQEPPLVRRLPNGVYEILAGHRRSRAVQLLALNGECDEKIAAFVHSSLSDREAIYLVAAEYAHRKDFAPLHTARVIGAAVQERRAELGREPSARELTDILPWEKSSIAAYRKVDDALRDPRLAPLVHRLDKPDISLLYKVLCVAEFPRVVEALQAYSESGAAAARRIIKPAGGGRPKKAVTKQVQGAGYDLTIRYRPSMSAEDVQRALKEVDALRRDLQARSRPGGGSGKNGAPDNPSVAEE